MRSKNESVKKPRFPGQGNGSGEFDMTTLTKLQKSCLRLECHLRRIDQFDKGELVCEEIPFTIRPCSHDGQPLRLDTVRLPLNRLPVIPPNGCPFTRLGAAHFTYPCPMQLLN